MTTKENETYAKAMMHDVMLRVRDISDAIEMKNFKRAHDLRDSLFYFVAKEVSKDVDHFTKHDIEEIFHVLVGLDDEWGL